MFWPGWRIRERNLKVAATSMVQLRTECMFQYDNKFMTHYTSWKEDSSWQPKRLTFIRHPLDPIARWWKSFFRKKASNLRNTMWPKTGQHSMRWSNSQGHGAFQWSPLAMKWWWDSTEPDWSRCWAASNKEQKFRNLKYPSSNFKSNPKFKWDAETSSAWQ